MFQLDGFDGVTPFIEARIQRLSVGKDKIIEELLDVKEI